MMCINVGAQQCLLGWGLQPVAHMCKPAIAVASCCLFRLGWIAAQSRISRNPQPHWFRELKLKCVFFAGEPAWPCCCEVWPCVVIVPLPTATTQPGAHAELKSSVCSKHPSGPYTL
jgi:hypothetical protein